jgi:hypothetical protein
VTRTNALKNAPRLASPGIRRMDTPLKKPVLTPFDRRSKPALSRDQRKRFLEASGTPHPHKCEAK